MSQNTNVLQEFKDTFLVANGYSDITDRRMDKLRNSRHISIFIKFFIAYFFGELRATKSNSSGNYCILVFEKEKFWIATDAVVNSLHHAACKYVKKDLDMDTIKERFKNDIFYSWNKETKRIERIRSPREWVVNLQKNFDQGSFHPTEQWKIQAVDTMRHKIASILGHLESRGFDAKERLGAIVDEYRKLYQRNLGSLHFCDFLSDFKEITVSYASLYNRNKVLELCYLAGLGERPTGDEVFNEPSWNLISNWAKKYSIQLNGYRSNLPSPPVNFSHPTDFWENVGRKKYGFRNLRDFYWNKKLIEGVDDCPPILKACLTEEDPIRSLEQVAFNMAWLVSDAGSLTEVINCENGLLALYETDNEGIFLRMVHKLGEPMYKRK